MRVVTVIVTYRRVSSDEQGKKGYSLAEQRRECRARAEQLAAELGAELKLIEFEDIASGEVLDRPGLDACREFIRNTPTQYFICLDPDRFSRNLFLQLLVTEEIEKRGVRPVFIQHHYENNPEGKLFYQMRGAVAEYEKAKIKERTRRGKKGKLAAGGIPAYVEPWGYIWDKQAKTLVVDPEKVPWVVQVYEWFVAGSTYQAIADRLIGLGVPPPKRGQTWYRNGLARILQNSVYVGRLVLNKGNYEGITPIRKVPRAKRRALTHGIRPQEEWVTVSAPAVVPEDLWNRAQALLNNRRRLSQRGTALLSGLCVCGLCGQSIHYARQHGKPFLQCYGRYPHLKDASPAIRAAGPCKLSPLPTEKLETEVWEKVRTWLKDPEALQQEQERQFKREPDPLPGARIAVFEKELTTREDEHRRAFAYAVQGLAPDGYEKELCRLKREIEGLRKALEDAKVALSKAHRRIPEASLTRLTQDVEATLDRLTLAEQQRAVRDLIRRITVWPDRWEAILR